MVNTGPNNIPKKALDYKSMSPANAAEARRYAQAERQGLQNSITNDLSARAEKIADDPDALMMSLRTYAKGTLQKFKTAGESITKSLEQVDANKNTWESRMDALFADDFPLMQKNLLRIADNLALDVPDVEDPKLSSQHPYIEIRREKIHHSSDYLVSAGLTKVATNDLEFLNDALKQDLNSDQKAVIAELRDALEAYIYASGDVGRVAKSALNSKENVHYTTRAINKMGRIGVAAGGVAGLVIFGVPALLSGGRTGGMLTVASAGIALASAFPETVASMFAGVNKNALNEARTVIINKKFAIASEKNELKDAAGVALFNGFWEQKEDMQMFVQDTMNNQVTPEKIEKMAEELIPEEKDPLGYSQLVAFLGNSDALLTYQEILGSITTEDTQEALLILARRRDGVKGFYKKFENILPLA